jgi:hypothetical protein
MFSGSPLTECSDYCKEFPAQEQIGERPKKVGDGLRPPPGQASRKVPRGLEDRFPSRRQQRQSSAADFWRKNYFGVGIIFF